MQKFSDKPKSQANFSNPESYGLGAGKDIQMCWRESIQSRKRILSNIPLIQILFRCDRDKKNNNQGKEKEILLRKMTDLRNQGFRGHNLRNRDASRIDQPFKIIRDQSQYQTSLAIDLAENERLLQNFKEFTQKKIDVPTAIYHVAIDANKQQPQQPHTDQNEVTRSKMTACSTADNSEEGNNVPKEKLLKEQNKTNDKTSQVCVKVPDLFNNLKIKSLSKILRYPRMPLSKYESEGQKAADQIFEGEKCTYRNISSVIPEHRVKFIDPVFEEEQNTTEKNWSFQDRLYEITEEKIQELKNFKIDISPNEAAWVIDCFEKTAINYQRSFKSFLIEKFRQLVPPEVSIRVADQAIEQIYDNCWKSQREKRKNRPLIRMFWPYQDSVGEDNYPTFMAGQQTKRPNVRGNFKQKLNNYIGCFFERENAVTFCLQLQNMHESTLHELDMHRVEDSMFDQIIGRQPVPNLMQSLYGKPELQEEQIIEQQQILLPFITKEEESALIDSEAFCSDKLNSAMVQQFMQERVATSKNYLQFKVSQIRYLHEQLRPDQPQMAQDKGLRTLRRGNLITSGTIGKWQKDKGDCIYDTELAFSDITVQKIKENKPKHDIDQGEESQSPAKNGFLSVLQSSEDLREGNLNKKKNQYLEGETSTLKTTAGTSKHKRGNIVGSINEDQGELEVVDKEIRQEFNEEIHSRDQQRTSGRQKKGRFPHKNNKGISQSREEISQQGDQQLASLDINRKFMPSNIAVESISKKQCDQQSIAEGQILDGRARGNESQKPEEQPRNKRFQNKQKLEKKDKSNIFDKNHDSEGSLVQQKSKQEVDKNNILIKLEKGVQEDDYLNIEKQKQIIHTTPVINTDEIMNSLKLKDDKRLRKQGKKSQKTNFKFINKFSILLHRLKQEMGVKLSSDMQQTEYVDVLDHDRRYQLRKQNFLVDKEHLRKLEQELLQEPNRKYYFKFDKTFRVIECDSQIGKNFTHFQFDYNNPREQQKNSQIVQQKAGLARKNEECQKQQAKLQKLLASYDLLKNNRFVARRGRNNQIFYKSQMKTIWDYNSDDDEVHKPSIITSTSGYQENYPGEREQELIEEIVQKNTENRFSIAKRRRAEGMNGTDRTGSGLVEQFSNPFDKLLANQRNLAEDIEKYCRNKRLKKNIQKIDLIYCETNGQRISVENNAYTLASSDPKNNPRQVNDPVLSLHFKQKNAQIYEELMGFEADRILMTKCVDPQYVYETCGKQSEQLQDYENLLMNDQLATRRTSASSQFYEKKHEELSEQEREALAINLEYIKSPAPYIVHASNQFYQAPQSLSDLKLKFAYDFQMFQKSFQSGQRMQTV